MLDQHPPTSLAGTWRNISFPKARANPSAISLCFSAHFVVTWSRDTGTSLLYVDITTEISYSHFRGTLAIGARIPSCICRSTSIEDWRQPTSTPLATYRNLYVRTSKYPRIELSYVKRSYFKVCQVVAGYID